MERFVQLNAETRYVCPVDPGFLGSCTTIRRNAPCLRYSSRRAGGSSVFVLQVTVRCCIKAAAAADTAGPGGWWWLGRW